MRHRIKKGFKGGIPLARLKLATAVLESCHFKSILLYVEFRINLKGESWKVRFNYAGWILQE